MQQKTGKIVYFLALVFSGLILAGSLRAQTAVENIIITDVKPEEFPQVTLRFRALDRLGRPVSGLTKNDLTVTEDDTELPVDTIQEVEEGVWIHFIVDAGAGLHEQRWKLAQAAILDFVETTPWMQNGLDRVAVTVVEKSGPKTLIDFTTDADSVVQVVENYSPPGGDCCSAPLPVIEASLEQMDLLPDAAGQAKFIVLFTPAIESGTVAEAGKIGNKAEKMGVPVYAVTLRLGGSEILQALTEENNGMTLQYEDGNSMIPVYRSLTDSRKQYEISYRSPHGSTGTRQVKLSAPGNRTDTVAAETSYDIEVSPPRVRIESPESGDVIVREASTYTADRGSVEPTTQTVVAEVVFADGYIRRLNKATLFVNDEKVAELDRPNPTQNLEFSWNLRSIKELGITDHSLAVEVEDELGLSSLSQPVPVQVDLVIPPEPTTGPGGNNDDLEQIVGAAVEEAIGGTGLTQCTLLKTPRAACQGEIFVRDNWISILSIAFSLGLVVVVYATRNTAPVQEARQRVTTFVDTVTRRVRRAEARAYLVVLEGDTNVGKSLEIYGDTRLGRSRQNADLLFQQADDNSPISRLHCTIIDEEDHFTIQDEDSANGTFLNGKKLKSLVPEPLHDGDEIELARIERGGVRLLFQLAVEGALPEDMRETMPSASIPTESLTIPDDEAPF